MSKSTQSVAMERLVFGIDHLLLCSLLKSAPSAQEVRSGGRSALRAAVLAPSILPFRPDLVLKQENTEHCTLHTADFFRHAVLQS